MTLTKFDSNHVTKVHEGIDIEQVPQLTDKTYTPGAGTPLYDAIGKTIQSTEDSKRNVLCVILTDGEENSSREFSKDAISKLITEKTFAGWTFVYLGANQDAWSVGMSLGIAKGNTKNYSVGDIKGVFGTLATANAAYSARGMSCGYATSNVFEQDENDSNLQLLTK